MMEDNGNTLTASLLKSKSGEFDLESIHTLNLSHMELTDLGCLGECSGLERLDLSFNDITKLYALAGLMNVTDLNLSANRITSLDGLQSVDNLKSLNLSGNLIGRLETLKCLSSLEKLSYLRLRDVTQDLSNPICMNISYKEDVLSILPNLVTLDDERLTGHGKEMFKLCLELDSVIKDLLAECKDVIMTADEKIMTLTEGDYMGGGMT
ncbi:hypothetical protein LSH36_626g00010 [Paralvinella palmiformis]|uniref:Uncharacterized protein n=1 Tax=Paralvinella palmiformis TaxID=53620 RepID=A0AAD9J4V8_9ANNE|nr:hypothetical protein LSH36_626g00010 [Paralvinella palmiformis]